MAEPKKKAAWEEMFPAVGDLKSVVLISGPEGSGKTHWAIAESPGPHYIIETEGEHNLHTAKEQDKNVRALVLLEELDASRDSRWFAGKGTMWDSFRKAVEVLLQAPPGTVIIDSATDLVSMVVGQLTIEWDRGDKAFPTMLYGQVYAEISTHISHLRKRHNVILTSRVKEIYLDDKGTGRFKTAIWKQAEYIVEHTIQMTIENGERVFNTRRLKRQMLSLPDMKWEWLMNGIPTEAAESAKRRQVFARIQKAATATTKEEGVVPDHIKKVLLEGPDTLAIVELEEYLEEISGIYKDAREKKLAARRRPVTKTT